MLSQLDKLRSKISNKDSESNEVTSLYYFMKELHCLPDVLGREYEVEYDDVGRIKKIIQLPISIPSMITLMKELEKDYKKQEKQMKKKGRRL